MRVLGVFLALEWPANERAFPAAIGCGVDRLSVLLCGARPARSEQTRFEFADLSMSWTHCLGQFCR